VSELVSETEPLCS